MARNTIDPQHTELTSVLSGMLDRNDDITARSVTRIHATLKNASDITRHPDRRAILEKFQTKQQELRKFAGKVKHSGTTIAAKQIQASDERVRELEANEAARVASHLAMISAMCELGGTAKLLKFYKEYSHIRNQLAKQGALPTGLGENTVPFRK
jgi:GTPase involved in cell partitioning and DNA repair